MQFSRDEVPLVRQAQGELQGLDVGVTRNRLPKQAFVCTVSLGRFDPEHEVGVGVASGIGGTEVDAVSAPGQKYGLRAQIGSRSVAHAGAILPEVTTSLSDQQESRAASRPAITVVIPAYRVAAFIANVLSRIPAEVSTIIVVDDASPDDLQAVLARERDPRLVVLRHEVNRGVGGAMKTGFRKALELGADIVVKVDGDGQMDPGLIPRFIEPIVSGDADFTKGNRFDDLSVIRHMPLVRRLGNLALSFLVKLASGYWRLFDPCNGYVAIRGSVLRRVNLERLSDRYFLEISLLCEAYFARAVLLDIPMQPVYAGETSSLSPVGSAFSFAPRLMQRALYRMFMSYFMRDFNVVSVFLTSGIPLMIFGVTWSAAQWLHTYRTNTPATTGTVMIGMLPIVLGFQLLLQALVLDVGNEPKRSR